MKKILGLFAILYATSALAGSTSTNFNSSVTISPKCTISGTKIDFGDVSPKNSGFVSVSSLINSICTKSTPYTIIIGSGENGDILNRKLKGTNAGNNDKLIYTIYNDPSFSQIIGDGTNGTITLSGIGTGGNVSMTIYGYLNLKQYISPDYYYDNLSVVINY